MIVVISGPDGPAHLAFGICIVDFNIQPQNIRGAHSKLAPWNSDFRMVAAAVFANPGCKGGNVHAGGASVFRKSVGRGRRKKKTADRFAGIPILRIGERGGIEEKLDGIAFPGCVGFPGAAFRVVRGDGKGETVRSGAGLEGEERCSSIREAEKSTPVEFQIRTLRRFGKIRTDHGVDLFRRKILDLQKQNRLSVFQDRISGEDAEGAFSGQFRLFQNGLEIFSAQELRVFGKGKGAGRGKRSPSMETCRSSIKR